MTLRSTKYDGLLEVGNHLQVLDLTSFLTIESRPLTDDTTAALTARLQALLSLGLWNEIVDLCELWKFIVAKSAAYELKGLFFGAMGGALLRLGRIADAEVMLRAAIHVAEWELQNPLETVRQRRRLAIALKNRGLWRVAEHELSRATKIADENELTAESGFLRVLHAILSVKAGWMDATEGLLARAESHLQAARNNLWLLRLDLARSNYRRLIGSPQQAMDSLLPALAQARASHFSREEAICLEYIGDCYLTQREYRKALEHYDAAQAIADATAPKGDLIPELGHRRGECLVHLGDANAAILACERGLTVARDTNDRYEECATHRVLAMAHRAAGNPTRGYRIAQEGVELGQRYEIPYELGRTLYWIGETRLQSTIQEEKEQGRQSLWEARAIFERLGLRQWLKQIDGLLGFDEAPALAQDDPGLAAVAGLESLDRGALRFGIVTASSAVSEAVATVQSIAASKIPVLITGPSGTGKELLARALHQMSDRRRGPFVPVNCGALAPGLLDSELFGHERGAFTGAVAARDGLFASASSGTIFLDEVGELTAAAQATLLRVLESGELRRVGTDDIRRIDVRVVAATNADLEAMVERGTFRRDLYYRLAGTSVTLPALSDREDDIVVLFRYFMGEAIATSRKRLQIAPDVEPLLRAYSWPGNVRELRNEVARTVAMAEDGAILGRDAFLPRVRARSEGALRRERDIAIQDAAERASILQALRAHRGNKADAARSLGGMKRTTLLYKIERLNIRPEEYLTEEK